MAGKIYVPDFPIKLVRKRGARMPALMKARSAVPQAESQPAVEERYVSLTQALEIADERGVSEEALREAVTTGLIEGIQRHGNRYDIPLSGLAAFLDNEEAKRG
jgi:hypothetical protein